MNVKREKRVKKLSLKSEVRDGYLVSKEMKEIWQVQLDLFEQFVKVCDRHNIDYTLDGGSLLGAIRHKGYVPWDDDIDVALMRDQYEKFLKYAKKELKPPYFIQNERTEPEYYRQYTQLRRSDTTAIIKVDLQYNYNCGISIDIFPLDKVPDNLTKRKKFLDKISFIRRLFLHDDGNMAKKMFQFIIKPRYLIKYCAKLIQKYNNEDTMECGKLGFRPYTKLRKTSWLKKGNFIKVPFEYLEAKITKNYDEYLTRLYGDYMTPPKLKTVGVGTGHGKTFFDTRHSYLYYKDKKEEVAQKL